MRLGVNATCRCFLNDIHIKTANFSMEPIRFEFCKFFFLISTTSPPASYLPRQIEKIGLVRAQSRAKWPWRMIEHLRHRHTPTQVVTQKHTKYQMIGVSARLIDPSSLPTALLIFMNHKMANLEEGNQWQMWEFVRLE